MVSPVFEGATAFSQDVSSWDTSSVACTDNDFVASNGGALQTAVTECLAESADGVCPVFSYGSGDGAHGSMRCWDTAAVTSMASREEPCFRTSFCGFIDPSPRERRPAERASRVHVLSARMHLGSSRSV